MFQLLYEEVLSHSTLLDTITAKSASITENYVTQLELQDLQERYNTIKDNAMVISIRIRIFVKTCKNIRTLYSLSIYMLHLHPDVKEKISNLCQN